MTDSSYAYGTVSVAANGTTVTGTDVLWSGVNARFFDSISIDGGPFNKISSVADETHLELVVPNAAGDKTDVSYVILWDSPLRFVGAEAREDVTRLLSTLEAKGLVWTLDAAYASPNDLKPIPSAAEGQLFYQPTTGNYWVMQSGAWTPIASPYGMQAGNALSEIAAIGKQANAQVNINLGSFTSADCNNLTNGWWWGSSLPNAPDTGWWTIQHRIQAGTSSYATQVAEQLGTGTIMVRVKNNGTWTAWKKLWSDADASATSSLIKLPNGKIIQFAGPIPIDTSAGNATVTFPVAFPTACRSVVLVNAWGYGNGGLLSTYQNSKTTTGFVVSSQSAVSFTTINYIAIGD